MSRRTPGDSDGRRRGEADEETGWLDDLRSAKESGDRLGRPGFADGGTDRWAKLSELSGDTKGAPAPPEPADPPKGRRRAPDSDGPPPRRSPDSDGQLPRRTPGAGREAEQPQGPGRRAAADPPAGRRAAGDPAPMGRPGAVEPPVGRRAAADPPMGRRAAADPPVGRRAADPAMGHPAAAEPTLGRRSRSEPAEPDPKTLIGRRARQPEPAEPDPATLVGRRARRPEPAEADPATFTGRRARHGEPAEPDPKTLTGWRARRDTEESTSGGRRGRAEAEPFPMPDGLREPNVGGQRRDRTEPHVEPERHGPRSPAGPPPPVQPDPPRRRSIFGERPPGEEPRRRSIFGERPPGEEPRRRPIFGERPPGEEPRRRSIFGERGRAVAPPVNPLSPLGSGPPPSVSGPPHAAAPPISPTGPISPAARPTGPISPAARPTGRPTSTPPSQPRPVMQPPPAGPGPAIPPHPVGMEPGADRPRVRLAAGVDMIKGARSEVRKQLREQQRLRMWTLITLVVALVGALPFYFVLRAATRDPVLTSLDALTVPTWAVVAKDDNITGSRWCLMDCRYRERTAQSERPIQETAKVYQEALLGAGWIELTGIAGCPPDVAEDEHASCWRRDEFTLDLWIREPAPCANDPLRKRPTVAPTADPAATAGPDPLAAGQADECAGSTVTIKVFNAIADERLRWTPESTQGPDIGELTDEDLFTPSPDAGTPTPQAS